MKDFVQGLSFFYYIYFFICAFFHPGTMASQAESINPDLQRGMDRRLLHTNIEHSNSSTAY